MEGKPKNQSVTVIGILLFTAMVCLTIYALDQQRQVFESMTRSSQLMFKSAENQSDLYRRYVNMYRKAQDELAMVTHELDSTKDVLRQTEDMLAQARAANADLQNAMAYLQNSVQAEKQMVQIETKQAKVMDELQTLKADLEAFQGNIKDTKEGQSLAKLLKNRLRLVRNKMQDLKRQAFEARIAAQKEQDRLKLEAGNRGYFINGQAFPTETAKAPAPQQFHINVSFVE